MTGLVAGEPISGTGIPVGTTIQSVNTLNSTITLSANATVTGTQTIAEDYQIRVVTPGAQALSVTTSALSVTPALAAQLVILAQPTAPITAGTSFGLSFAVADSYGNVEPSFNGPVTIALSNDPDGGVLIETSGPSSSITANSDRRCGHIFRPLDRHGCCRLHDRGHRRQPPGRYDQLNYHCAGGRQ